MLKLNPNIDFSYFSWFSSLAKPFIFLLLFAFSEAALAINFYYMQGKSTNSSVGRSKYIRNAANGHELKAWSHGIGILCVLFGGGGGRPGEGLLLMETK